VKSGSYNKADNTDESRPDDDFFLGKCIRKSSAYEIREGSSQACVSGDFLQSPDFLEVGPEVKFHHSHKYAPEEGEKNEYDQISMFRYKFHKQIPK